MHVPVVTYVMSIVAGKMNEDLFLCKEFIGISKAEYLFDIIDNCTNAHSLEWSNCVYYVLACQTVTETCSFNSPKMLW